MAVEISLEQSWFWRTIIVETKSHIGESKSYAYKILGLLHPLTINFWLDAPTLKSY